MATVPTATQSGRLPGDLCDCRLVLADWRGKVWLGGENGHAGNVLLVARPALLDLGGGRDEDVM